MKALTLEVFSAWLEEYGRASRENDARASSELFALDAQYCETPFAKPMIGREAIYEYWNRGSQKLKDKEAVYEIFSVRDNVGIARWQAKFTAIESGKRLELDCMFVVEFNDEGLCQTFREWWHIQALDGNSNQEVHHENS